MLLNKDHDGKHHSHVYTNSFSSGLVYASVRVPRFRYGPYRQRPDVTALSHNVSTGELHDDLRADWSPNLSQPYRVSTPPHSTPRQAPLSTHKLC